MRELLNILLAPVAVSGHEGALRRILERLVRPLADEVFADDFGNLYAHRKGDGPSLLVTAHMDAPGVLVTHIDERGYARFSPMGLTQPASLPGSAMAFTTGAVGVVGTSKSEVKDADFPSLYLDVGAGDREAAERLVSPGSAGGFDPRTLELSGKLASPGLCSRASCAAVVRALEELSSCAFDLTVAFTAQRQLGARGAVIAAQRVRPVYALTVDTAEAGDIPGGEAGAPALGEGPAVKICDDGLLSSPRVIRWLEESAREIGMETQREVEGRFKGEGGVVQLTRSGVVAGGLAIPARYRGTPCETAALSDIENAASLLRAALGRAVPGADAE